MEFVYAEGDEIFRDGDERREGGDAHEKEEDAAEETAVRHGQEDARQCDENQAWPRVGFNVEGEAAWEDDEPCAERDECVQPDDNGRFLRERFRFVCVTTENGDRSNTDTKDVESQKLSALKNPSYLAGFFLP